jgi:hypothetical protein
MISEKTRERRGWPSEAEVRDHVAEHTTDCRCRCRYCAALRKAAAK